MGNDWHGATIVNIPCTTEPQAMTSGNLRRRGIGCPKRRKAVAPGSVGGPIHVRNVMTASFRSRRQSMKRSNHAIDSIHRWGTTKPASGAYFPHPGKRLGNMAKVYVQRKGKSRSKSGLLAINFPLQAINLLAILFRLQISASRRAVSSTVSDHSPQHEKPCLHAQ